MRVDHGLRDGPVYNLEKFTISLRVCRSSISVVAVLSGAIPFCGEMGKCSELTAIID